VRCRGVGGSACVEKSYCCGYISIEEIFYIAASGAASSAAGGASTGASATASTTAAGAVAAAGGAMDGTPAPADHPIRSHR
jgi:hypothetical protein